MHKIDWTNWKGSNKNLSGNEIYKMKIKLNRNPKIGVLMPVHNASKYLAQAIESILKQSFTDFEFIIINDGSTDSSLEIIKSFNDPRIIIANNKKNLGLIVTLNKGLKMVRGKYVARMDADDFSYPDRLASQVEFLDKHSEVGICGTWFKIMGTSRIIKHYVDHKNIQLQLFHDTAFGHPTIMMRKNVLEANKLEYDYDFKHSEDYELWTRMERVTKMANIPQVLFEYRQHEDSVCSKNGFLQEKNVNRVRIRQLSKIIDQPSDNDFSLYTALLSYESINYMKTLLWIIKLGWLNYKKNVYKPISFFWHMLKTFIVSFTKKITQTGTSKKAIIIRAYDEKIRLRSMNFISHLSNTRNKSRLLRLHLQYKNGSKNLCEIPVIINNFNRITCLKTLITWLEKAGMKNLFVIDNNSTYPALLKYYESLQYTVFRLNNNVGYLALWKTKIFKRFKDDYYIYTDPDILPIEDCPNNFVSHFFSILQRYPEIQKIGFGLKIDDIPDWNKAKNRILGHESQFWKKKIENGLYDSDIDTTFALYRPGARGGYWLKAYRTGYPYLARHLPWYQDSANLNEEERYYKDHANDSSYWSSKI